MGKFASRTAPVPPNGSSLPWRLPRYSVGWYCEVAIQKEYNFLFYFETVVRHAISLPLFGQKVKTSCYIKLFSLRKNIWLNALCILSLKDSKTKQRFYCSFDECLYTRTCKFARVTSFTKWLVARNQINYFIQTLEDTNALSSSTFFVEGKYQNLKWVLVR